MFFNRQRLNNCIMCDYSCLVYSNVSGKIVYTGLMYHVKKEDDNCVIYCYTVTRDIEILKEVYFNSYYNNVYNDSF